MRRSATCGLRTPTGIRFLKAAGAHTPVTRADGPSAVSGRQLARTGERRQQRQTLGHAASRINPFACGTQAKTASVAVSALETGWARARMPPAKRRAGARVAIAKMSHTGARMQMRAPRARLFAQSFRTAPRGNGRQREGTTSGKPCGRHEHGAMTHVFTRQCEERSDVAIQRARERAELKCAACRRPLLHFASAPAGAQLRWPRFARN